MARPDADLTVTLSVLDRLIDVDPKSAADPPANRSQSVRHLKAAVRRDLEWLLNTRRNPDAAPESYRELCRSVYNYGLPDISSLSLSAPQDRARLLHAVESTVATFEPRLRGVRVTPIETGASESRTLRFQIEGLLAMDPAPEQVSFDTLLQLTSGEYQIQGDQNAR
jgi:type VI secretion system protein ImpF